MSEILIFSPEKINIGEYRDKYPELKTIKEFQPLSNFELVFIWYYCNPTSYYVYQYTNEVERAKAICDKMYEKKESGDLFYEKFVNRTLMNQEDWDSAIERMSRVRPEARRDAKTMLDKIFKDYQDLLDLKLSAFEKKDGSTDYNQYLSIRKTITKDMEEIIEKVEARIVGAAVTILVIMILAMYGLDKFFK